MNKFKFRLKFTDIAGIGTWAMVFGLCIYWLTKSAKGFHSDIPLVSFCFLTYLLCFVIITRDPALVSNKRLLVGILFIQLASAFSLLWILPVSFLPILTIIWVSILPHVTSLSRSIVITVVVVVLWFSIYQIRWNQDVFFSAMLYSSFHLFSILMMHHAKTAEKATAEALRLNSELMSTRQLLSEVSKQSERTRIARDLHDLLGHHLTALIINLQIAEHLTEGEAKGKVEQCHSLAKLLMSDVREAVTSLRENQTLELETMLDELVKNVPKLQIHRAIDKDFNIEDIETAKTILSCIQEGITNSLKHAGATDFWVNLTLQSSSYKLQLRDNGKVKTPIHHGHGLLGMKERVEFLNGNLTFNQIDESLVIDIALPRHGHAPTSSSVGIKNDH